MQFFSFVYVQVLIVIVTLSSLFAYTFIQYHKDSSSIFGATIYHFNSWSLFGYVSTVLVGRMRRSCSCLLTDRQVCGDYIELVISNLLCEIAADSIEDKKPDGLYSPIPLSLAFHAFEPPLSLVLRLQAAVAFGRARSCILIHHSAPTWPAHYYSSTRLT